MEVTIYCVNILKTVIEFKGRDMPGTEDDTKLCHLDTAQPKQLKLHITHRAHHFREEVFLEQLSAELIHYLNYEVK